MYLVELVILQILFWMLEIRDIFGVNGRCWGRPKYKKNMSVPPAPLGDQAFVQGERLNHYTTEVFLMAAP